MDILVNGEKLNLLLESKKEFIGKRVAWDSIVSSASFLISVFFASYNGIPVVGGYLKIFFVLLGMFFTGKSIFDVYSSKKNCYTNEDLFSDINKINEIKHNHSIVAIKDEFNKFPNRFLTYYDKDWDCKLFINFKENINNESFIKKGLSNELKIDEDKIELDYIAQNISTKYSEKHKEVRCYCHRLYTATLEEMPNAMQEDKFNIDGIQYQWMTLAEMEADEDIMKKNADIVSFVKQNCN